MTRFIERQCHFIDFTIGSLLRHKVRNGSLFLVYTLIVFVFASVLFFTRALHHEAVTALSDSPEIIVQRNLMGRYMPIPKKYVVDIGKIRGVISVKKRLWGYYYDNGFEANYTLVVPLDSTPTPGNIYVGCEVARSRGLKIGDILPLSGYDGLPRTFRIERIFSRGSALLNADMITMSEEDYRALSGLSDSLTTDIVIAVRNSHEYSTIAEKIRRLFPDTRPIVRTEILRTYDAVYSWRSGIVILSFMGAFLAFLIFVFDKASGLSAEEKKEIGILKATGWETTDILFIKFWEGIIISLSSFLIGVLGAYINIFFGGSMFFVPILKGWSTLYPVFTLSPTVSLIDLLTLFFLSVVPFTIAIIVPSWHTATTDPDSIMR